MRDLKDQKAGHQRIALLAKMQDVASSIIEQNSSRQDLSVDRLSLIRPITHFHHHTLKTSERTGQRVLIEYLDYKGAVVARVNEILERVNAIASLRNQGIMRDIFPVLKCQGYYHEPSLSHFGIVYELPRFAKNTDPLNLIQIIRRTKSKPDQPSLTVKFKLASTLVQHVLSFHKGGWLHKGICSFTIAFFPKVSNNLADSFSSPYFIGFNHSRINDDKAFSNLAGPEADYQHPAYLRNAEKFSDDPQNPTHRYRQEFDYYSVGLVLLEIALWQSLKHITGAKPGSPENVQAELLSSQIPVVRACMGDRYSQSIQYCLSCDVMIKRTLENAREEFYTRVINPLSQCLL